METYKCAFNGTLVAATYGCKHAEPVARRSGPDIACRSPASHRRCAELFERFKSAALPAFGVEDDLLTMPHSVLMKIQHGGPAGLQRLLDGAAAGRVEDVDALIERALATYGAVDALPCAELVGDMTGYQLKRRRG